MRRAIVRIKAKISYISISLTFSELAQYHFSSNLFILGDAHRPSFASQFIIPRTVRLPYKPIIELSRLSPVKGMSTKPFIFYYFLVESFFSDLTQMERLFSFE